MKALHLCILLAFLILASCNSGPQQTKSADEEKLTSSRRRLPLPPDRYNVAILIMDGVYNTELTAPYDIFQHTIYRDSIKAMNVFLLANKHEAVTTFEGIQLLPDFNYLSDTLPPIDILVVPSAEHHLDTDLQDTAMISFVKQTAEKALYVTSHCDGAFVLAKAGLLDGKVSTTFPADISAYRKMFPGLDVRENVIFVHHGKYITSAGGARSFDAALYLCEVLYGKEVARRLAKGLVIDWNLEEVPKVIIR